MVGREGWRGGHLHAWKEGPGTPAACATRSAWPSTPRAVPEGGQVSEQLVRMRNWMLRLVQAMEL